MQKLGLVGKNTKEWIFNHESCVQTGIVTPMTIATDDEAPPVEDQAALINGGESAQGGTVRQVEEPAQGAPQAKLQMVLRACACAPAVLDSSF